jgi:hypothetical protein
MPDSYKHYAPKYRENPKDSGIPQYPYWMEVLEYLNNKQYADKYKEMKISYKNN